MLFENIKKKSNMRDKQQSRCSGIFIGYTLFHCICTLLKPLIFILKFAFWGRKILFLRKKAIKQKTPFQPPYFFLILPISQRFNLGPSAPIHNCCSKDPHIYTALHNYFIMKFCLSHGSHKTLLPTREVGYIRKPTLFYSSKKHP